MSDSGKLQYISRRVYYLTKTTNKIDTVSNITPNLRYCEKLIYPVCNLKLLRSSAKRLKCDYITYFIQMIEGRSYTLKSMHTK